jgi:hypothetical protein
LLTIDTLASRGIDEALVEVEPIFEDRDKGVGTDDYPV